MGTVTTIDIGWHEELRTARKVLGLSRAGVATRVSLSAEAVRNYETGRRHPSRENLIAILNALQVEQAERNRILIAARYAPEGPPMAAGVTSGYVFTIEEAAHQIEEYSWPSMIINEAFEVVAANGVAQRLWGINLFRDFPTPIDRNLISVATDPRFAPKVKNWDEAVATAAAILKGHHRGAETLPEGSGAYFAEVMRRFFARDPQYVARFLRVWEETPPRTPKVRWSWPVVWEEPDIGTMRFKVLVSSCSEPDALAFNDWIPLDAVSWEVLSRVVSSR